MKRLFILFLVVGVLAVSPEKPDFSGEWHFDKSLSQFDQGGERFVPVYIKIKQSNNSMFVEKTFQREYQDDLIDKFEITLDGQENNSMFGPSPRIITASWSAGLDTLDIQTKITFQYNDQPVQTETKEKWFLNEKNQMVRDFMVKSPWGTMNAKYVFVKTE